MREIRLLHGRLPCKGGGLTGMHIDGVLVSILILSVVDWGFKHQSGQIKDNKIGINLLRSLLSMQHYRIRAKTGWLGITIICPFRVTCLPTDCCFSELALWKFNWVCWCSKKWKSIIMDFSKKKNCYCLAKISRWSPTAGQN